MRGGGTVATFIGTSGFGYEDWKGVFYPADLPREDYLRFYSMFFPFVELDFSYFKMPESWRLEQLAASTPKDFLFTVKAHRSLTGDPQPNWFVSVAEFARALRTRPFRERLGGVLLQFSHRFRYQDPNRLYLGELTKELAEFPLFLEFGNSEWLNSAVLAEAEKRGIGIAFVDDPYMNTMSGRELPTMGPAAYARFQGRNVETWRTEGGGLRYDYSYADAELAVWVRKIAAAEKGGASVFVAFGNHAHGNAVRDARRLKELLDAERPRLETLTKAP